MPNLKDMDGKTWKGLKASAGIKSSPWYKKGHADVGKYIDKYQAARAKWKAAQTRDNLLKFNSALVDLDKAMTSFASKKEFKTDESKDLLEEIKGWQKEIAAKREKLEAIYESKKDELAQAGADEMGDIFSQINKGW